MPFTLIPTLWNWLRILPLTAEVVLGACQTPADPGQQPSALTQQTTATAPPAAHAQNDFNHSRPLFDALPHGFSSV